MEIGLYSFAEMPLGGNRSQNGAQRMDELMDEIISADTLGLDVYAVGEHHRPDYLLSAPTVV